MRYAKLIDGSLVPAPRWLPVGEYRVCNPSEDQLREAGYKPVRYTETPTAEPGYIVVPGWTETAEEIVQTWAVEEEPDEISEELAYRIITGEDV